jgi:putative ABC transport system permease protein
MAFWSRMGNVFRGDRLSREIDEELQAHVTEAIEHGRDPAEARHALGPALRTREASLDIRLASRLASLRADIVFGWRQLMKRKVTSAAAILSLALATGACTSAFRLIDALLLRPLPVAHPERLYSVVFENIGADGKLATYDSCSYPMFRQMRADLKGQAEAMAVSYADRVELTYGRDQDMERAYRQFVSGWMFDTLGLRPALGRLLTEHDDVTPGAHPLAVLSYDYWTRRFARDPRVIGRTFRMGEVVFEIAGVAGERFTGTETGTVTDIFVPMMMKTPRTLSSATNFWLRTLVQLKPGVAAGAVHERLRATFRTIQQERSKDLLSISPKHLELFLQQKLLLEPAAAGRSNLQRDYRRSLLALGILVMLVLLIACANVANLMTAQAASRAREMALRISIGAGRWRLVQLVMVEAAWLALLATGIGGLFAWQSAPFIVGMINPPDDPARLALPADWRVLGFALALACAVTFLFGMAPAMRASAIQPVTALKGGEDPNSRRRVMHALIAVQVAFCFVVHFVAGLFVTSFDRLSNQPTGFSAERILNLEAVTQRPEPAVFWDQVAEQLRGVPGVEKVAMTVWPLMSGESAGGAISVGGAPANEALADFLRISPGWFDTMRIPRIDGRDLSAADTNPPVSIVNQTFAKQYFNGENPVGKWFESGQVRFQVVGFVRDARSRDNMRIPIRPTAYFPLHAVDAKGAPLAAGRGTFVVRTRSANPMALASILRQEVPRARSEFYVTNIRAQTEINRAHTLRERLLAMLALFFAGVAVLLAGIGLYGVLDYGVLQRRREIGIRVAIGAQPGDIARRVGGDAGSMVLLGTIAGIALGMASMRYIEALLYEVQATDLSMLILPSLVILAAAAVASVPAVIRAVRIDPAKMLRAD